MGKQIMIESFFMLIEIGDWLMKIWNPDVKEYFSLGKRAEELSKGILLTQKEFMKREMLDSKEFALFVDRKHIIKFVDDLSKARYAWMYPEMSRQKVKWKARLDKFEAKAPSGVVAYIGKNRKKVLSYVSELVKGVPWVFYDSEWNKKGNESKTDKKVKVAFKHVKHVS